MTIAKVALGNQADSRLDFTTRHNATKVFTRSKSGLQPSLKLGRSSFSVAPGLSQQSTSSILSRLEGEWSGTVTSPGKTWNYEMTLERRSRLSRFIVGTSVISVPDNPSFFGVISLTGRVRSGRFLFQELKITEQNPPPGVFWCLKGGRLKISDSEGGLSLSGFWSDPRCASGSVFLQKEETALEGGDLE